MRSCLLRVAATILRRPLREQEEGASLAITWDILAVMMRVRLENLYGDTYQILVESKHVACIGHLELA